jgi:hypothetical protein
MKTPHEMKDALKTAAREAGARVSIAQGEDGYKRKVSGAQNQDRYSEALSVVASRLDEWGYDYTMKGRKNKRILFDPPIARREGFQVWYK